MEVQVQTSAVINRGDNAGTHQLIPLNIFDLLQENIHVAVLYAFAPPTPSNSDLIRALSQTLLHFPTLVAQLGYDDDRRPCFRVGDAIGGGALVVEATVASDLSDHLPLEPSPDLRLLHPEVEGAAHLFQVQLNRFRCGGLVVGTTSHHKAADGQSMSNFMIAWAQAVRGAPVERLPVHDRSWLKRGVPEEHQRWSLDFVPVGPEEEGFDSNLERADPSRISNILLHYSSEYITRELKSKTAQKYTTFELMTAHLWRKITLARGLDDDDGGERTLVRFSVNGRRKLNPPVPDDFFGNVVLFAYSKSGAKQLTEGGLEGAAKAVHDAILGADGEYFRHVMDLGPSFEQGDDDDDDHQLQPAATAAAPGNDAPSPVVEVDSWLGFRFLDVDLGGGGKMCGLLPTWLPLEGLVVFLPSVREGGGVDVFVTLLREHADRLREISHLV